MAQGNEMEGDVTRNTVFDTDHEFKPGWSVYCEVCELLDWMHDGPRMPKKEQETE